MEPKLIDNQKDLDDFIKSFESGDFISLDTEFVRRNTYYAKLSLMQIAIEKNLYVFDALNLDLRILWDRIIDSNTKVIIHSGRQDLEILSRLYGKLPRNLLDTQIAAKYCGFRSSVSYGELCSKICQIDIDKTHQSGDWMKRPLTSSKIEYASMDVAYLKEIYLYLVDIMDKKSLNDIVETATEKYLLDPALYENKYNLAWKKVKFQNKRRGFIKKMEVMAAFREESAARLDIPRRFFATDMHLVQLCNILPQDNQSLRKIRYLRKYILMPEYKEKLFAICKELADSIELAEA